MLIRCAHDRPSIVVQFCGALLGEKCDPDGIDECACSSEEVLAPLRRQWVELELARHPLLDVQPWPAGHLAQPQCRPATGDGGSALHQGGHQLRPERAHGQGADLAEDNLVNADFEMVLPAAIDDATGWFMRELKKLPPARAMVHSKVVLLDPFGADGIAQPRH
jgi:hypothetical protein